MAMVVHVVLPLRRGLYFISPGNVFPWANRGARGQVPLYTSQGTD